MKRAIPKSLYNPIWNKDQSGFVSKHLSLFNITSEKEKLVIEIQTDKAK